MARPPNSKPQPQPRPEIETSFSLTPAIFTDFSALPNEARPVTSEEKIERILRNLDTQHGLVRRNMVALLKVRKEDLVKRAGEEIAALPEGSDEESRKAIMEQRQKDRKEVLQNVRVKVKQGSFPEDYELKRGDAGSKAKIPAPSGDVDVVMTGMGPRSATTIRQELCLALQHLVDSGVAELEAYDKHAAKSASTYKQALKRREERRASTNAPSDHSPISRDQGGVGTRSGSAMSGRDSKRNGTEHNVDDVRRLGYGMPISRLQANAEPTRTFESVKEIARRGNARK